MNKLLTLLNEILDSLPLSVLFEDLSSEQKAKLANLLSLLIKEWNKWKNFDIVGTTDEEEYEKKIDNLLLKSAMVRPFMENLKKLTKDGITDNEIKSLKLWDNCEKILTMLQNKLAKSSNFINKNKGVKSASGKELKPNKSWEEIAKKHFSEEINYFNY